MQTQSRNVAEDSVSYAPGYEGVFKSSVGSFWSDTLCKYSQHQWRHATICLLTRSCPEISQKFHPLAALLRKCVLRCSSRKQPLVMSQRPLQSRLISLINAAPSKATCWRRNRAFVWEAVNTGLNVVIFWRSMQVWRSWQPERKIKFVKSWQLPADKRRDCFSHFLFFFF